MNIEIGKVYEFTIQDRFLYKGVFLKESQNLLWFGLLGTRLGVFNKNEIKIKETINPLAYAKGNLTSTAFRKVYPVVFEGKRIEKAAKELRLSPIEIAESVWAWESIFNYTMDYLEDWSKGKCNIKKVILKEKKFKYSIELYEQFDNQKPMNSFYRLNKYELINLIEERLTL